MDRTFKAKIRVIKDINQLLTSNGQSSINDHDFDILWDMDVDELIEVLHNLERKYESRLINLRGDLS